ncbi:DUF1705 domain-containing protein [Rickettsiales endosymbiont of Peranema trichophorum]|uniref:phosphoethanolamine transferase n=1 Tax=Rickettsiales endosymbiont of Peranema trichophorum TaxID=2486577 RepID=UPI001022BAE3|nr:phosphoethanolamine transferase [Rickettsiales endosymbiont of Peranema trichophorum]RZI47262.1 DUF1705 domain-containing protein [Rickettsiales endosymbiont of Peranema trichophorum]
MFKKEQILAGLSNALLTSLIYTLLFHLPVAYNRAVLGLNFHSSDKTLYVAVIEVVGALFLNWIFFSLLSVFRYFYLVFIPVFFCFGAASDYYVLNFGKSFDIGVLQDMIGVEWDLVREYLSVRLVLGLIAALSFGILLSRYRTNLLMQAKGKALALTIIILFGLSGYYDYAKYGFYTTRLVSQAYMPFSVFYNLDLYFRKYGIFKQEVKTKKDISQLYKFNLKRKSQDPIVVVMVIGESLRGDMFYPNGKTTYENAPHLMQLKDFVSFKNATSSSSSTRVSIPYMMTRAIPKNWEQATSETSIISIFKKLGFKTAWIGTQGAFRTYDFSYGSIAMEADKTIIRSDIRRDSGEENVYDEYLLPYLDQFLKDNQGNNLFITLHMMGSHWIFDQRYPEAFKKFHPTCNSKSPSNCERNELLNSYHNSVLYSDWVLKQVINRLEDQKAFLLFASDHGYSLYEKGYFGNAYEGEEELTEQYDIAMFAWASEKYLQEFKANYNQLRKKDNVSHNNLFHSLLGCVDVHSDILEPHLNLCQ